MTPRALLLLALWPGAALAAGWEDGRGKVSLEGATLALDFEDARGLPITVKAEDGTALAPTVEDDGERAIEGSRSLRVGGDAPFVSIELESVREALVGRRIQLSLWQRPLGTRFTGDLRWRLGALTIAAIALQPTGRVTTDGWEEWSAGPVDFALGELTPSALSLYDEQYYSTLTDLDPSVRVAIDALYLTDLGPARAPAAACRLATEAQDCGPDGACVLGRCGDASAVIGAPLAREALRREQLARHAFELLAFEGSRRARALLPGFASILSWLGALDGVRAWWSLLHLAYDSLDDGQLRAPRAGTEPAIYAGACAYLGEADLLPGRPTLPLVFERDARHPVGAALEIGDVIVAIDGLEPMEWAARARRLLRYGGDPEARAAQLAPRLLDAALRAGARVSVERCAGPGACSRHELELAGVVEGAIAARELDALGRAPLCDFRFERPVSNDRVAARADFAGSRDLDGVRAVQVNGAPSDRDWLQGIERAFADAPARVLLDLRLGDGGAGDAIAELVGRLSAPGELAGAELWPWLGEREAPALGACAAAGCAGLIALPLQGSSAGIAREAKLAVLLGRDTGGSELVLRALSRRAAETRSFGPGPTVGAFGPRIELPRLPGEVAGPALQGHDTALLASEQGPRRFESGRGVAPDERVLQRQSDLVLGVDTALARARAYLEAP